MCEKKKEEGELAILRTISYSNNLLCVLIVSLSHVYAKIRGKMKKINHFKTINKHTKKERENEREKKSEENLLLISIKGQISNKYRAFVVM